MNKIKKIKILSVNNSLKTYKQEGLLEKKIH